MMKQNKREMIHVFSIKKSDFRFEYFRVGGNGGQKVNKTSSGVRIIHIESGISTECRETRSQHQNKRKAFVKLANKKEFKDWIKIEVSRRLGEESLESQVEKAMNPKNLQIDVKDDNGGWMEVLYDEHGEPILERKETVRPKKGWNDKRESSKQKCRKPIERADQ